MTNIRKPSILWHWVALFTSGMMMNLPCNSTLLDNPEKAQKVGNIAGAFVASGRGATEKVLRETF